MKKGGKGGEMNICPLDRRKWGLVTNLYKRRSHTKQSGAAKKVFVKRNGKNSCLEREKKEIRLGHGGRKKWVQTKRIHSRPILTTP